MNPSKNYLLLLMSGLFICLSSAAQTRKVHLVISELNPQTPSNARLFMAGNMNNWNPADSSYCFQRSGNEKYELMLNLPPGINEFKITRGSWETVETKLNGEGLANRSLVVNNDTTIFLNVAQWQDNFKALPRLHTTSKNVRVIDTAFNMPQLSKARRVWIYLPPDYKQSKKRYPVIYMHDGQNLFDSYTAGYGEWGVDELMDSLYREKKPMAIIVGIDHGDKDRLTEYNPYNNSRFGKGRGADYTDFIALTLKPYIDKNFRTRPGVKSTGIAGSSMGGLISMYALAKYPNIFGKAGVFSPAFWIAPEIHSYLSTRNFKRAGVYFVAGALESDSMVPDMKQVYQLLVKTGLPKTKMQLRVAPDGKHSEWFWHREFPDFYKWFMN